MTDMYMYVVIVSIFPLILILLISIVYPTVSLDTDIAPKGYNQTVNLYFHEGGKDSWWSLNRNPTPKKS
jgi:hypothetical protein